MSSPRLQLTAARGGSGVTLSTLVLALSLGACDSGDEAPAPAKPAAPAKAAPETPAKAEKGATGETAAAPAAEDATKEKGGDSKAPTLDAATRDKMRTDAARVRTHLGAARDKAKAGEWTVAVAEYKEAIALDPDNPRILGELGWAQFNAEQPADAEHNLRLALRYERDKTRRADLLYKLGRVEEARGDWVKAKEHYDHSLALVENPETREHDEAVAEKAAAACKDGACTKPDYPDLAAACAAMVARVHEQQGLPAHSADPHFKCDPASATKVALTGGDSTEAAILVVKGEHLGTSEEEHDLLAHIEGGWHWVGTILDIENPHDGGILRSGTVKGFEARELMPESPGTEVLVHVELIESDVDLDDNMIYHDEHEAFIVCGINAGTHVCHEIPTRMSWDAEALDPTQPVAHDLASHAFTATATFDGAGNVTVEGTGEVPEAEKGTHKISELPEPDGFVFLHGD